MDKVPVSFLTLISTTLGVVTFVVGCATAYLRLFVAAETSKLRDLIRNDMDDGFARKEMMESHHELTDSRLSELLQRVQRLEARRGS